MVKYHDYLIGIPNLFTPHLFKPAHYLRDTPVVTHKAIRFYGNNLANLGAGLSCMFCNNFG